MYIRKKLHEKYVTELLTQSTQALRHSGTQALFIIHAAAPPQDPF